MSQQPLNIQEKRLAALYEVSSQLGKSLDLKEVLNQVMDSIIQLTNAERGFLMLYDDESGELSSRAARNIENETILGQEKISRTVIDRAITSGQGVLTNNAQEDERFSGKDSVVGYQLRSILCAPLQARGRTLGAVYVDNRLFNGVFQEDDLGLLVTFANQAAIAIENARLFTQTDQALARRVDELSLFQRIDQQLNHSLDLDRVLSLALNWAIALTNADGGSIGLLELANGETNEQPLRLLVYRGVEASNSARIVPPTHPVLKQVLKQKKSVVIRNVTEAESIDGTPATVQLAVPIQQDGIIAGMITLESQHYEDMMPEDMAFVERLADRAAVAINNARLYRQIQAANRAKSEFVSLVTHELRLPMTSIKGYTDLINSEMAGPINDQQRQFLDVIRRNLDRMGALISDLSDINRIESGRMSFDYQDFDLSLVIEEVVDNYRKPMAERNQKIAIEAPEDLPPVYADPDRINQVLTNLVSNAHKYTPDGGAVIVRAGFDDAFARVSVIDTGIGISEEDQKKLFTQFFRSENADVRAKNGWGLGLSIVRKMVEAQGGEIDFTSQYGQGSQFVFSVPLAGINGS
ncbi:MAG: GAF domain-containing protein [Anaerolineales bacterium]|nr:GAF domain-containing protein [Anaerolineales bacterium]